MSNTTKLAFDTGAAGRRVAGEARSPQLTYRLDYPDDGCDFWASFEALKDIRLDRADNVRSLIRQVAGVIGVGKLMVVSTMKNPLQVPSWLKGGGNLEAENRPGGDAPLWYSRFVAVAMLLMYGLLIFFQLGTHSHLFEEEAEDGEEEEPGILGFWGGVTWLGIITVFISILSQWIVDTIEGAASSLGMPILFISGILVPIVGNAAEHAAAVVFAYRNKMEIALGSAVGSAVQISVFVIPLCVVLGWMLDKPMTMNFHFFETATMLLTSVCIAIVLMDGKANWLKGAMLILGYALIGAGFWAHADPTQMS
ncbi:CAX3 [Symbiodinium natans]|uniref:CAX3 protein n=1 Tax=Symbiodinium natans TaxID=878477 RepID=A0A812VEQ1_9DINO|nr:CAX3 [Symbiodinium natans]